MPWKTPILATLFTVEWKRRVCGVSKEFLIDDTTLLVPEVEFLGCLDRTVSDVILRHGCVLKIYRT